MRNTPKGLRLQIGIFGRRNTGKSSLLNALTGQDVSIVSATPGTTTDPVEKAMELLPIGPVLWIDTAGLDDTGSLGQLRKTRSAKIMNRIDIAFLITEAGQWDDFEQTLLNELKQRQIPVLWIENKSDLLLDTDISTPAAPKDTPHVRASAITGQGLLDIKQALINLLPPSWLEPQRIVSDLVRPGGMAVLVVPIDLEAPKGRLILPQVQTIRDLLDHDAGCAIVKERGLRDLLANLRTPPDIVVTDSQAFLKVASDTPRDIPLTSFSILFARLKGDLDTFVEGALAVEKLRPGDRILIAEACTHHPVGEDIGRVKIPRWLTQFAGGELQIDVISGHDFPDDPSPYSLVIHCGSCMFNRQAVLGRILRCREAGVPITNYGMTIAYTLGIFERALAPFQNGGVSP